MTEIVLSVCSTITVSVPDGSKDAVSEQEAKDAVGFIMPYQLEREEFLDATIEDVKDMTYEVIDIVKE